MGIILAVLLAQFAHRSNPGVTSGTPNTVTTNGTCPTTAGTCVVLTVAATNTVLVNVSGTWTGTLSFFYSNDNFATTKIATAMPVVSGVINTTSVTTTTANGDWILDGGGYYQFAVVGTAAMTGAANVRIDADPADSLQTCVGLGSGGQVLNTPFQSSTTGTGIACNSGTSPCSVTSAAQNILSANANRKSCFMQANDVVDFYCKRTTAAGSAASATNFDFILAAGSGALKAGANAYQCDSQGTVWTGPMNCIASAANANRNFTIMETQ